MSKDAPGIAEKCRRLLSNHSFLNIHTYGLYCNHYKHVDLLFKGSGKGKFIIMLVITTWGKKQASGADGSQKQASGADGSLLSPVILVHDFPTPNFFIH